MRRTMILFGAVTVLAGACGGGTGTSSTTGAGSSTSTTAGDATTTTAAATTTTAAEPTTTAAAGGALTETGDGVYTIDWSALTGGVFFAPPAFGALDPFFFVHTDPAVDGFFFSVEAYTVYGPAWTGELGTFPIDCTAAGTGICVHFDPDGPGPIGDLGADFMVTGDVEIVQADGDGFEAVFSDVTFSDGSTIPGPFTVTG